MLKRIRNIVSFHMVHYTQRGERPKVNNTSRQLLPWLAVLFIAAAPFILQSFEFRSLAATLEMQREMASDARQDQAAVVSFENEWGLINDFPQQRLREAMFYVTEYIEARHADLDGSVRGSNKNSGK